MIGVYDYTVILTYLSMISGAIGIIVSMSGLGHPLIGCVLLMFSGLCDTFDGSVARTKKDRTELEKAFGIQIDSLSDLIAFGALPASIGIALIRIHVVSGKGGYTTTSYFLTGIAVIYILAGMIRLAYFNACEQVSNDSEGGSKYFMGVPITVAALVYPLILIVYNFVKFDLPLVYFGMMAIMTIAFVIKVKIPKPGLVARIVMTAIGVGEIIAMIVIMLSNK